MPTKEKLEELKETIQRLILQSQYEEASTSSYLKAVLDKINRLFGSNLEELE